MRAYVNITSWEGRVSGAVHYYGRLKVRRDGERVDLGDVRRILTAEEAARLCKEEGDDGWKEGDESIKFWSEDEVKAQAIKMVQAMPEITLLTVGDSCVLDPQPILLGPEPLMEIGNKIVAEAEANDWWEGDEPTMKDIWHRWCAALKIAGY